MLLVFAFNSCSPLDDNLPAYRLDVLPIESYTLPESFDMNTTYPIKVTYKKPSNCYAYDAIFYQKDGDTRILGIQVKVSSSSECITLDEEPVEIIFDFDCTPGYRQYVFKFYKGKDADGNNIFEEAIVPVTY